MCVCVPSKAEKNKKVEHVRSGHAPVAQKKKQTKIGFGIYVQRRVGSYNNRKHQTSGPSVRLMR